MNKKRRCPWCNLKNPVYVAYHDQEWGRLRLDDGYLYEMLILESFQAGLSWECVLNKREAFREAYDGFDPEKVCAYDETKTEELLRNEKIIRNRRKILASIRNSVVFKTIISEYGSFYNYLKIFAGEAILQETGKTTNSLADAISKDLYQRGMRFVGPTIVYAYLQAIGLIDSHEEGCWLYRARERK